MQENDVGKSFMEAAGFFEKARRLVETKRLDEAIEMYIEGLRCEPEAVSGHIALRELARLRESKGWAKPSMADKFKHLRGRTPLEQMLGAEYLLAKDPGNMPHAEAMLKAAVEGGYKETAKWLADLVFLANKNAKNPSLKLYLLLKDMYAAMGSFDRAMAACEYASKLKPGDKSLSEEVKRLAAQRTSLEGPLGAGLLGAGEADNLDSPGRRSLAGMRNFTGEEAAGFEGEHSQPFLFTEASAKAESSQNMEKDNLSPNPGQSASNETSPVPGGQGGEDVTVKLAKAKAFFEKAEAAAQANNFDYAIDMYLDGIRCNPDAVAEGHIRLCELALRRKGRGGKKPTIVDKVKRMRSKKIPLDEMLDAEFLFAKDPDHLPYAEMILKGAVNGGFSRTAVWIGNLIFQTTNAAEKPSVQTYLLLKESYEKLGELDRAIAACQRAMRIKPEDNQLAEEYKRLTAERTVATGKYDQEGDFRNSIKDRQSQEKLQAQQSVIKSMDFRVSAVEEARQALAAEPEQPKNIYRLAEALSDLGRDDAENEAIKLLENTYHVKRDFAYRQRAGQFRIKQLKRKLQEAKAAVDRDADDKQARLQAAELSADLDQTELEHYRLCVENYPTDLRAKYEYGVRLIKANRYDEAIPMLQAAQREPLHKIAAMDKIGLCFFMMGWMTDAIDVFTEAIDSYEIKNDDLAKELRYNLGRAYQENGDTEKALEVFRKIAQLDFAYKDVSKRIDKLRGISDTP